MDRSELDRLGAELHRRGDVLIKALRDLEAAEASGDADAISEAKEAAWQARLALAVLAMGDEVRDRMMREIEPYDDLSREENGTARLEMHRKFLIDTVDLGHREVTDPFIHAAWRTLEKLWDSR